MRPKSIIVFERLYVIAFLLGLVSTIESWSTRQRMLAASTDNAAIAWLSPVVIALGIAIAVALWWFTARRPAIVAKWAVVALAAWGLILVLMLLYGLVSGRGDPVSVSLAVLQNAVYVAAAAQLFHPDSRAWFGEDDGKDVAA